MTLKGLCRIRLYNDVACSACTVHARDLLLSEECIQGFLLFLFLAMVSSQMQKEAVAEKIATNAQRSKGKGSVMARAEAAMAAHKD